jgi:DNA-binding XRE family transcriptional regulator
MEQSGRGEHPYRPAGPTDPGGTGGPGAPGLAGNLGGPGEPGDPSGIGGIGDPGDPGELPLPLLPGFREMALRRMATERRRLVGELAGLRKAARLSQTEVAARMGTSQSAVARLESGDADVRASTLERYAAAIGSQITWRPPSPLDGEVTGGEPER